MKKIFTILLAALGLNTACSQNYEDMDVQAFAELIADTNTVVLDVRTAAEFNEAHIKDAVNIDQFKDDFVAQVLQQLPKEKTIAAKRAGVIDIIMPKANEKDFTEIQDRVRKDLNVHYVEQIEEVFALLFK